MSPGFSLLGKSVTGERSYQPNIEGTLPSGLKGTLYRNGPGLFERNGVRRKTLLDGDGFMQAYHFSGSNVQYVSKFVRTRKYVEENAAKKFLYRSWALLAPGPFWKNLGSKALSQAGVTPVFHHGKLMAFDDNAYPYEMTPRDLLTVDEYELGSGTQKNFNAHTKVDGKNSDLITFGHEYGKTTFFHYSIFDKSGNLKLHSKVAAPRMVYLHDFFCTENFIIFNVPPIAINALPMMFGLRAFLDCWKWKPELYNLLIIVDRHGKNPPRFIQASPSWMWHSLNAYEDKNTIVADFVGYKDPGHFLGKDAQFRTIMDGKLGNCGANGTIRRYIINLGNDKLEERVLVEGNFEFPTIDSRKTCLKHRFGYFTKSTNSEYIQNGIMRLDFETMQTNTFSFGDGFYCGEPIFASGESNKESDGYILTQVLDSHSKKSFLAVLDANNIESGPVATVRLDHHLPISFHGCWVSND